MTTSMPVLAIGLLLTLGASAPARAAGVERPGIHDLSVATPEPVAPSLVYRVAAGSPRLNRRILGPVRRWLDGVAAEPVDSACWSGEGSVPIEGRLELELDPTTNTGHIIATWTDMNGVWTYEQTRFIHPGHHSSGVRIGSSMFQVDTVINEGIAANVYLHGDTGAGMPLLPTVFAFVAAWGPVRVTLNGEPFDNPFEIPAPLWLGHVMVTEGVRQPDGSVRTLAGGIYNPTHASEGAVEPGDVEAHLVFHDDLRPVTSNVPDLYSFFYHVVFEDVRIEIVQSEGTSAP